MDDTNAFDRQLARVVLRRVGPPEPVDDAAIYAATASQSPKWRVQPMFSATKFVVAGAIVALFGGFLMAGVLTTQPSEEAPAAVTSVSASPELAPTAEAPADPETSVSTDLLPGVDLVTEEVEPGVYRVLRDGVRDLVRLADQEDRYLSGILDGNVVAGLDGSVWWFDRDGFYRLGEEVVHPWPNGLSENHRPGQSDLEVGPDGTVWLTGGFDAPGKNFHVDISSYDTQTWTSRWQGAAGKKWALDVEVQQDGTVWMAWSTKKGEDSSFVVRAARLGDDGWEILPGTMEAGAPGHDGDVIVAEGGGSDVWLMSGIFGQHLHRHDDEGWVVQETPDGGGVMRAAVGPGGTLWVRLNAECGPELRACFGPSDILARFDGSDWEVYDSSDGIPMMGDHYQGFEGFFAVAPDRSIWFNPIGDYDRTGTECDGIANFDGETVKYYLRDTCIYAMDLAPDGTVWLQAGEYRAGVASGQSLGKTRPGPISTYVITPEAVAAAE